MASINSYRIFLEGLHMRAVPFLYFLIDKFEYIKLELYVYINKKIPKIPFFVRIKSKQGEETI
jgi:hypothetical protein